MEGLNLDEKKLNKDIQPAADLPTFQKDQNGKIILTEDLIVGVDEKENKIVPDEFFDKYYKELPEKVINESKSWRTTATGGKIKILGGDPEGDKLIQLKGNEALKSTCSQRRSIREILEEISTFTVSAEEAEEYGLKEGTTLLEAANLAQVRRAMRGDTKAAEYIRDTLGEKPTEKLSAEVTALTPEDKEMLQRISSRLKAE